MKNTLVFVISFFIGICFANAQCPVPSVSSASSLPACPGSVGIVASSSTSGVTHRVYNVATGGSPLSGVQTSAGNPTVSTYTTSLSATKTFYVSTYRAGQCESARQPITITIKSFSPSFQPSGNPTAACPGEFFMTASSGSAGTTTYQWLLGGSSIPGATNAVYFPLQTGSYSVQMNNGCQTISINNFNVTVINPVPNFALTTSGDPNNFCANNNNHKLSASGATSYQWLRNGSSISGATSSSYHPVQSGTYSVNVTGSGCTVPVQRGSVAVSIVPAPTISTSTNPAAFCTNIASHTLNATGGTGYQWKLNGSAIQGATASSYHPTASGSYSVDVTNVCGVIPVGPISVTTTLPTPSIAQSGNPNTICRGAANTYLLTASTGSSYQWKKNGSNIAGATSGTYKPTTPGSYSVVVGTSCGNIETSSVSVTGAPPVAPTVSPTAYVCHMGGAMLTAVSVTGNTHKWYNANNAVVTHQILNTTGEHRTGLLQNNAVSNVDYFVSALDACGESTRTTVSLRVKPTPSAPTVSGNKRIGTGTVTLTASSTETGTFTYKWYNPNDTHIKDGGTYSPSQTFSANVNNAYYVVTSKDGCPSAKTWVNIVVCSAGSITPSSNPNCVNSADATFLLNINGATSGSTYQWKLNGAAISGATGSSYHPVTSGSYSATVTTPCGSTNLAAIPVTVFTSPSGNIEYTRDPSVFCSGSLTDKLIAPTGYQYQWKLNGNAITGATQDSYHPTQSGNYTVDVGNGSGGCVYKTMGPVSVTIISTENIPAAPSGSDHTSCSGQSVKVTASSTTGQTHRWYTVAQGGTQIAHTVESTSPEHLTSVLYSGSATKEYFVASVNTCAESTRKKITVFVNPTPGAPVITGNKRIGTGTVTLTVNPTQSGHSYDWFDINDNWLATGSSYSPPQEFSVSVNDALSVVATKDNCSSAEALVSVQVCSTGEVLSDANPSCVNAADPLFSVRITGATAGSTYQWKKNGTPIAGATASSYHPLSSGSYAAVVTTQCGSQESSLIPVTIYSVPAGELEVSGDASQFCTNNVNHKLIAPDGFSYQWKLGGGVIQGATQRSYHPMISGSYTVDVGNSSGCVYKTLGPIQVTIVNSESCPVNSIAFQQPGHSVNPVTGMLNVSIPLFTVAEGDIQVPGSLNYTGTGVRVTDDAGWTGQNWSLSVQGYGVTRELRGLPDDYTAASPDDRKGWLLNSQATAIKNFIPTNDDNPATCSDEITNYNFLNGISFKDDTEPDLFSVSAPGLFVQFYFDENKQVRIVPHQDVEVTPITQAGPNILTGAITSFTVKDARGVEYKFQDVETMTQRITAPNTYYQVRKSNTFLQQITYNSGWKLSQINSPIYGTIDFTYREVISNVDAFASNRSKLVYKYPATFTNATNADGKVEYERDFVFKVPSKISCPSMEVEFLSTSNTNTSMGQLSTIKVYDKREGSLKLARFVTFNYASLNSRSSLMNLIDQGANQLIPPMFHYFEYYGGNLPTDPPVLPLYSESNKDEWGFYKMAPGAANYSLYDETVARGSLKKITYPQKGYSVFFYEPHKYWNGTQDVQGGGLRTRKIVTYDGVSAAAGITEYEYLAENGQSSGKLQHLPGRALSVARVDKYNSTTGARYRDISIANPGIAQSVLDSYFTVSTHEELSNSDLLLGSAVAYARVKEKISGSGYTVYEYELPASYGETSANNNDWEASKVLIARPNTGNSFCFEKGATKDGYNVFPFPPHPDYDFAQGLLKKKTDFRDDNVKRREVLFEYQPLYTGSALGKIYGLAIEELPTYYHNGSAYVDGKMFLFSRYAVYTDVKTVIKKTTEIVYPTNDLARKNEIVKEYFYESPNHRELTRVLQVNSDKSKYVTRFKYLRDYTIATPGDPQTTALKNLELAHRTGLVVESINSRIEGTTEEYLNASLQTFQVISGKAYPHQQFLFTSNDGESTFQQSSVQTTGGVTTFSFDQVKYVLNQTTLSFDGYGNPKEAVGRDRQVAAVVHGFSGSLPVLNIRNAKAGEVIYSDFETATDRIFSTPWSPTLVQGRHGSKAIILPAGSGPPNALVAGVIGSETSVYTFSCWLLPSASGTLTVTLSGTTSVAVPVTFTSSAIWKYYTVNIPITPAFAAAGFSVQVRTDVPVPIDDIGFYPMHASIQATTYAIPFGPSIVTDGAGNTSYTTYDDIGRVKTVLDRDENLRKKYDYQIKP